MIQLLAFEQKQDVGLHKDGFLFAQICSVKNIPGTNFGRTINQKPVVGTKLWRFICAQSR